jgi:hypothetical protein
MRSQPQFSNSTKASGNNVLLIPRIFPLETSNRSRLLLLHSTANKANGTLAPSELPFLLTAFASIAQGYLAEAV